MDHQSLLSSMEKFGTTPEEICLNTLGVGADKIHENILLSPGWFPERMFLTDEIEEIVQSSPLFQYKIWNITHQNVDMTYVKTGFGAAVVMDVLLLLRLTERCKKILFVSSVGGLSEELGIGDIVLPVYSACGDGASRYLSDDFLSDTFGEKQYADNRFFSILTRVTENVCGNNNVKWHFGKTFCTDTIVAQYNHLEKIVGMGYNSVDMESAAAFKTGGMLGMPIAALLNVSDNSVVDNKSLMNRRTDDEQKYRRFVGREVIPQIIVGCFNSSL